MGCFVTCIEYLSIFQVLILRLFFYSCLCIFRTDCLTKYTGSVVVVSHDERFLKSICNELWIVKGGGVKVIRCLNSDEFKVAFDQYASSLR